MTTVRQGSSSQKKDIIRQLETILDCDEHTSCVWKYICDPCRNTATEIFTYCNKNTAISDEVAAITDEFVAKYKATGEAKPPVKSRPTSSKRTENTISPKRTKSPHSSTSSVSVKKRENKTSNPDVRKSPGKSQVVGAGSIVKYNIVRIILYCPIYLQRNTSYRKYIVSYRSCPKFDILDIANIFAIHNASY